MDSKKNNKDTDGSKPKISEKISNYYGNVKSRLLGNDLTGRRQTSQADSFGAETSLTGFKRDREELHLKPKNVDLSRASNRESHHTSEYEVPNLIIRRGQAFDISIEFNRNFIKGQDTISLKFVTGNRPSQSRGSVTAVHQVEKLHEGQWGFELVRVHDNSVTLCVSSGSDAAVGCYEMFIDTTSNKNDAAIKYRHKNPDDIFLLFNPWIKEDAVYVSAEAERKEYVQAETGSIWLGTMEKPDVRPWNFGQFEDVCLIAAISILDRSELSGRARGNPALVARAICKAIHFTESDGGLVQANWSGNYDDAEAPFAWAGSPSILEEFLKTRKGVKYGQCWTMAAVATTLLRTIGVASRCVTCYKATHDSDFSDATHTHWSHDLKPKTEMDDGVWNFHIWIEAWFLRPDLPTGYDGWQALDPTPLDCSEGVLTSGPAPVKAILNGDLYLGFDTKFIFAELNGSRVHWQVDVHGDMEAFMEEDSVCGTVCTKSVGSRSKDDLTASYRHPQGSKELSAVLEKARKLCNRKTPVIEKTEKQDVEFSFNGSIDKSGDIKLTLQVHNRGAEGHIVDAYVGAVSSFYTGVTAAELKKIITSLVLEPKKESGIALELKCADYINQKPSDSNISAYIMARVRETGQRYTSIHTYSLDAPHLNIKTDDKVVQSQNFTVVVKLTNTLSVPLTQGVITIDGPGLGKQTSIKLKKQVEPGEQIREALSLTARRPGVKEIIAVFYCRQISNISAVVEIDIANKK